MTSRFNIIRRSTIAAFATLVLFGSAALPVAALAQPASGAQSQPVRFVDLLWLKPGVLPKQAGAYFDQLLAPVLQKYGAKRLFIYQVAGVMRGNLKPAVLAGYEFPSMQAMQALFKDPEYQKVVPHRDATFDLSQQKLFQVTPLSAN